MSKVHNFSAGPGILPLDVLKQASDACINFDNLNLSLLEISHRSKNYEAVIDESRSLVKELFEVGDEYEVLYLGGGASMQFAMVPYNLLSDSGYAAYVNTGVWASKAIKEAKIIGNTKVIASSEDKNFSYIPKDFEIPSNLDYFHFTSNNTIFGTQFKDFPKTSLPLVCDMSSDIFSKEINVGDFDIIYAGAQKNLGPAGATLYIVKDEILGKSTSPFMPTYLDLKQQVEKESMLNTPPVFSVYVSMLNLRNLKANGGVKAAEERNNLKASLLYNEIDNNPLFMGPVAKEDRSNMNVTFLLNDESKTPIFDQMWKDAGIVGLPGHRSAGGYRASMYNALPVSSVEVLVEVMKEFGRKNG